MDIKSKLRTIFLSDIRLFTKEIVGTDILITFICFTISSITIGHFIRQNDIDDLFMSEIKFDLNDSKLDDSVTYYSNYIHAYFLVNNFKQRNKAIVL